MAYVINTCLDSAKYPKCQGCPHCKPDPERFGENSCYIDEDLQGKERYEYLLRLYKHFTGQDLVLENK